MAQNKKYKKQSEYTNIYESEQNVDQYGRAMTKNGKYYSGFQVGYTKESYEYEARVVGTDGVQFVNQPKVWVTGYNISKRAGTIKFQGIENSKSVRYQGEKNGNKHILMFVECFYENTGVTVLEWVDVNITNKTAVFKKMNMLADGRTYPKGAITRIVKKLD
ncbi:hypothetical protein [Tenacibaculum jejuense]|uniref:Uncharacterized protein n=1 Tax=Tenacibaculum jejuense TaxID=584609 RepID=A0A238U9M2_9FLAO|nr:hypothetical protein [Tenacibaculum jejuense]SNR15802.1 protein of unknown function [Tenacibaculum jejuense]